MAIARGYAATDASKPLTPFTFERREPNDDDVVIDIKYAGICHSDIHTVRNEWHNAVYPIVPGHEIAGVVRAVGSKVTRFKVGDHVGVGCFVDSCVGCATAMSTMSSICRVSCRPTIPLNGTARARPRAVIPTISWSGRLRPVHPGQPAARCLRAASLRRHHALFAAAALECRPRQESGYRRHGWPWPHGREDRLGHGR